jgi:hypothetical protein
MKGACAVRSSWRDGNSIEELVSLILRVMVKGWTYRSHPAQRGSVGCGIDLIGHPTGGRRLKMEFGRWCDE